MPHALCTEYTPTPEGGTALTLTPCAETLLPSRHVWARALPLQQSKLVSQRSRPLGHEHYGVITCLRTAVRAIIG